MPLPATPLVAICLSALTAVGPGPQDSPPSRDVRAEIEVVDRGTGVPVVLRWRTDDAEPVTVQVTTRTVPAAVETPGLDDAEPDVRLAGFMRPPIEKAWMLQGRLDRQAPADGGNARIEARWRVLDAAARLVGVRPVVTSEPTPKTPPTTEDGPGAAPPRRPDQPTTRDLVSPRTGDDAVGSDPTSMAKAIDFERITNDALQKTDGAAITQVLGVEGVLPGASTVRLLAADRRADFEASGLLSIMALAEPTLPSEPLGVGGSWRSRWTSIVRATPVVVDAVWTVHALDDAAISTGIAERATLRVEFTRRVADGASVSEAQQAATEATGRGEIEVHFARPLRLEGRFVETPITTLPGRSTDVTRMRLTPMVGR